MKLTRTTKQFIRNELYKLCDGKDTSQTIGKYSTKSTWQPPDLIKTMIRACLEHTSVEDICSTTKGPSADTIHRRSSQLNWQKVEQLVNNWLVEIASRLRFHKQTKITIAIDLHQQPYYGNPNYEWVTGGKKKKGTNYAISFLIVTITTGTIQCPVLVQLVTKERFSNKVVLVSDVIAELKVWLNVKRVLLDRWFCQEDILQLLVDRELEFVIAAHRFKTIKIAAAEIQTCVQELASQAGISIDDPRALGCWTRKHGLDTFRVEYVSTKKGKTPIPLVAAFVQQRTHNRNPLKRERYCLFLYLTNVKVSSRYIVKLYSKRWLVETDIRCITDFIAVFNRDALAIDATDVLSNHRNQHNLDPEAGYGHKTDGKRFHGYWVVYVAGTTSEMVRAVEVTPANIHQSMTAQRLFQQLKQQDLRNATLLIADSAYDDKKTYDKAIKLELVPLITYNPKRAKIKSFERLKPSNWRKRSIGSEGLQLRHKYFCLRSAVERYQSTIKELLNGRAVPVRGILKVKKHLYALTILTQLYGLVNWSLNHTNPSPLRSLLDNFL